MIDRGLLAQWFWCAQAESYCETLAVLREFCGCWPAYTVPALPSGLNAEPGADAAFPGVFGAVALPQLWFGWPVRDGPRTVVDVVVVGCVPGVAVEGWCVATPLPGAASAAAEVASTTNAKILRVIPAVLFILVSFSVKTPVADVFAKRGETWLARARFCGRAWHRSR